MKVAIYTTKVDNVNKVQNIIKIDKPTKDDAFAKHVIAADAVKCKLTSRQNMILFCLQNGWALITSNEITTVLCGNSKGQFEFTVALFYRLVHMGFIYQQYGWPHNYELTELGKKVITKKLPLNEWM